MHQLYQNKLTLQQEQKSIINLTEGKKKHAALLIENNILRVLLFDTNL